MRIQFFALIALTSVFLLSKGHSEEALFINTPKAELHLHLGGSFPKEYLLSISSPDQQKELIKSLELVEQMVDYKEVFTIFRIIAQVINTEDKLKKGVEELCLALQKDGVHYVEIRTGLRNLGQGYEEYLKAVLRGMKTYSTEEFVPKLVLSLQRSSSLEVVQTTLSLAKKYQAQGVVGIDISGNSTLGQIEQIMPQLVSAKEAGISFLVHLGEHPDETDQMVILKNLEPKRIGHAVYLTDEAKEWVLSHQIPIEVCLSSSLLCKMVTHFNEHPGIKLYRMGHPIVFCTDDPLLFSTTLSKELQIAHEFCGISKEEIETTASNSFQYALKEGSP